MKEVKILHLFPNLLNLYGEYANLCVIQYYLEQQSYKTTIVTCEDMLPDLSDFDMIYIASGTEENILHAIKLLLAYKNRIQNSIENGQLWLATGNSLALFGKDIKTADNNCHKALDIFTFTTTEENIRFSGDILTKEVLDYPLLGYVNNSYIFNGISSPFSELTLNKSLGNNKKTAEEGFIYKNFYSTSLTGPLLVKNPHLTEFFIKKITGKKICISPDDYIKKAYNKTLSQLKKRKNIK